MLCDASHKIEIEFSGITRATAAEVVRSFLGGTTKRMHDSYDTYEVTAPSDFRVWKLMSDASITCQKKENGRIVPADRSYSVELVSPILTYDKDIVPYKK